MNKHKNIAFFTGLATLVVAISLVNVNTLTCMYYRFNNGTKLDTGKYKFEIGASYYIFSSDLEAKTWVIFNKNNDAYPIVIKVDKEITGEFLTETAGYELEHEQAVCTIYKKEQDLIIDYNHSVFGNIELKTPDLFDVNFACDVFR